MPQLQCDGKCFLAQQLNEASNSNEDHASKFLNSLFDAFIPVYITKHPEVKFINVYAHTPYEKVFGYYDNYKFLSESNNFKPPIHKI